MRTLLIICCVLLICGALSAKHYGHIPDESAAIRIARAELIHVYGKKQIQSEEPLGASLKDDIWNVCGTLWCTGPNGQRTHMCLGGVACIKIRRSDGKILSISHTK